MGMMRNRIAFCILGAAVILLSFERSSWAEDHELSGLKHDSSLNTAKAHPNGGEHPQMAGDPSPRISFEKRTKDKTIALSSDGTPKVLFAGDQLIISAEGLKVGPLDDVFIMAESPNGEAVLRAIGRKSPLGAVYYEIDANRFYDQQTYRVKKILVKRGTKNIASYATPALEFTYTPPNAELIAKDKEAPSMDFASARYFREDSEGKLEPIAQGNLPPLKVGDKIRVRVDVHDDLSGLDPNASTYGYLKNDVGKSISWRMEYIPFDGSAEATFAVGPYTPGGKYVLDSMASPLTDRAQKGTGTFTPSHPISFKVENANGDHTPPSVDYSSEEVFQVDAQGNRVPLELGGKITLNGEAKILLTLKVSDDRSGFAPGSGGYLYLKRKVPGEAQGQEKQIYGSGSYNEKTGRMEYEFNLNRNVSAGDYKLDSLNLSDREDNSLSDQDLMNRVPGIAFHIDNPNSDDVPPKPDYSSFAFHTLSGDGKKVVPKLGEKAVVKPGEKLHFSFKLSDDKSGISNESDVSLDLIGPQPVRLTGKYNPKTGLVEGEFSPSSFAADGEYTLTSLSGISDDAGNSLYETSLERKYPSVAFKIDNPNSDTTPPQPDYSSLRFEKLDDSGHVIPSEPGKPVVFGANDRIRISVKFTDDKSGIAESNSIYLGISSDNGKSLSLSGTYHPETGRAEFETTLGKYTRSGTFTINSIQGISDKQGNSFTDFNATEKFTEKLRVENPNQDVKPPDVDLSGLEFFRSVPGKEPVPLPKGELPVVRHGETLIASIPVKDDLSGVALNPSLGLTPTGQSNSGNFNALSGNGTYLPEKGRIHFSITPSQGMHPPGPYDFSYLNVSDEEMNAYTINSLTELNPKARILVVPTPNEPPLGGPNEKFISEQVSKTHLGDVEGERAAYTLTLHPDLSTGYLAKLIHPASPELKTEMAPLFERLHSKQVRVWRSAMQELETKLSDPLTLQKDYYAILQLANQSPHADVRWRAVHAASDANSRVHEKDASIDMDASMLHIVRSLSQIHKPEAKALLRTLASGPRDMDYVKEAKAALEVEK